ncbi:MAG TPA: C40 family peptidase [Jatrophihabitans sp.]|nr:C40 family peptidase [Jatrophihabitans sp.]
MIILGLAVAAVAAPTLAVADPATPAKPKTQPTISSVEKQLGELAMQSSQLVETYNQARITEGKRAKAAKSAAQATVAAKARYTASRRQFVQLIQAQYQGSGLGAAGALLDSNSDTNYLDRLDTLNLVSTQTAQIVQGVKDAKERAAAAEEKATQSFADAKAQRAAVGKKRDEVEKQIGAYKTLLNELTAKQRARIALLHGAVTDPNAISVDDGKQATTQSGITISLTDSSKKAQTAVKFALAQVGKPYVFGAAGPGAFDCSGLTMAAWHRAGVNLPHSAADQYNYGHHVARNALQPGDLLFFYQPIGHVTMYVGDGLMVSAPTEGEPVQVVTVASFDSDYTGATRLT